MSDDKYAENDPERTLITLDQLSQTIEVMTSVVNRLRQHLSEQIKSQVEAKSGAKVAEAETADKQVEVSEKATQNATQKRESFVVEISQQEAEPVPKTNKILH